MIIIIVMMMINYLKEVTKEEILKVQEIKKEYQSKK